MASTYHISIPNFSGKQKKIEGKRQFIRLDTDIWANPKISELKPALKLLYIFLLTTLDENGEAELTDNYIKKQLDLDKRFDVTGAISVLSEYKLCTCEVQSEDKVGTKSVQNVDNLDTKCTQNVPKNPGIYKDTRALNKIKENKENKTEKNIVGHEEIEVKEIVDYLNLKANTSYKSSGRKTRELIQSRINEGFTLEDFKKVIDIKCEDWLSDSKMSKFLRPETIFSNKFESYLNQKKSIGKVLGVSDNTLKMAQALGFLGNQQQGAIIDVN